jgi:hypothetical protein
MDGKGGPQKFGPLAEPLALALGLVQSCTGRHADGCGDGAVTYQKSPISLRRMFSSRCTYADMASPNPIISVIIEVPP